MANTYTQLLVQLVFAVKGRQSLITESIREPVQKYICGIITNNGCKPLAIYCNPDHIHILIGFDPKISISKLTCLVKTNSSKWINENNMTKKKFSWQVGYGAFSYVRSQLNMVVNYILNQPIHHQKVTFEKEYLEILKNYDVEFDKEYLFDFDI